MSILNPLPRSKDPHQRLFITEMAFVLYTTHALSSNVHKHESLKSVVVDPEGVLEAAFPAPPFYIL